MSLRLAHRFVAELQLTGGRRLRTAPLAIDWSPAVECLHFQAVRRGAAGIASAPMPSSVMPQWDTRDGEPYVASVLLALDATTLDATTLDAATLDAATLDAATPDATTYDETALDATTYDDTAFDDTAFDDTAHAGSARDAAPTTTLALAEEIALAYFEDAVRRAASALVATGRIAEGDAYTWRLCALDAPPAAETDAPPLAFSIEAEPDADPVLPARRLSALRRASVRHGPLPAASSATPSAPRDFPLFIRRSVLDEAGDTARAAGELEAGGILLGHLARTTGGGDLVMEITAQVPAREAIAGDVSLRFTPQTWQAVHAAIRLRHAGERIAGWWHSHPRKVWPCHACTPERRATCPLNHSFFSEDDMWFHRAAFSAPSLVGLLLSFQDQPQPRHDLYGWRQGLIAAREYYVLEG